MKNILAITILFLFEITVNAQADNCNCSNDSLYSEDPIIQKIQTFNPTISILKDTISTLNDVELNQIFSNKNVRTIWVVALDSSGNKVKLNCGLDFTYDCKTHEFKILNSHLIRKELIIEIYWIEQE